MLALFPERGFGFYHNKPLSETGVFNKGVMGTLNDGDLSSVKFLFKLDAR